MPKSSGDGFELKVQTASVLEDRSRVEVQCGRGRAGRLGCGYEGVSWFGVLSWPSNTEPYYVACETFGL